MLLVVLVFFKWMFKRENIFQLEKEKWKRSDIDFTSLRDKFDGVNVLIDLLFTDHSHKGVESSQVNGGNRFEERDTSSSKNRYKETT